MESVADATAALHHANAERRAAEVGEYLAVAALCDLHQVDESVLFEGAERWITGGGDGTPLIGEFVVAHIATALEASIGSAFNLIATVLNLRHRHPSLWQAVMTGSVRTWQARIVAERCEVVGLSWEACQTVDRHCAVALAQQPFARVLRQLDGWILLADPAAAAEREAAAAERRHVSFGEVRAGHVPVWAQLDAADGLALDDALSGIAEVLPGEDRNVRRAAALGVMARHALGQEALPLPEHDPACAPSLTRRPVEIVVRFNAPPSGTSATHVSPEEPEPASLVADVQGWGQVRLDRLAHAFTGCQVTVRPILIASQIEPVDAYEVPDTMRLALNSRFPIDTFPYGTRRSRTCDADHTIPYDHHNTSRTGQTRLSNLSPLSRFTHRLKTHGGWHVDQPQPGVLIWTSPLGYRYLVTRDGTVLIDRPPPSRHDGWRIEPPDHEDEPPEDDLPAHDSASSWLTIEPRARNKPGEPAGDTLSEPDNELLPILPAAPLLARV